MPIGYDQVHLLFLKQAEQAQDPGAAAMAAAAKQAPSAMPVPTFVPPGKPEEAGSDGTDAAKVEEAHRKELERKDKELNALRNNAQVMQMQLAHQKALAALDRHRDQIYKSIEKKEEDHRRHMEKEDAALQQHKERMQADEIKHQAKMDVISAQQHAQAAEDQAKLTAQNAQQSARDYMKMTADAQRAADNYFGQKSKDFEKRQRELDAQQKALDAQGSRISPIVMNSLQRAVKATSELGDIRSKLQATPGIVHSQSVEGLPKVAAIADTDQARRRELNEQMAREALRVISEYPEGSDEFNKALAVLRVVAPDVVSPATSNKQEEYLNALQDAYAKGSAEVDEALKTIDNPESAEARDRALAAARRTVPHAMSAQLAHDMITGDSANLADSGVPLSDAAGFLRAADALDTESADKGISGPRRQGKADTYRETAARLEKYYESVANDPNVSEATRLKAQGELASLDAYRMKTTQGLIGSAANYIGRKTGHPEWGKRSEQDLVTAGKETPNFLSGLVYNDRRVPLGKDAPAKPVADFAEEQWGKASEDWSKGNYASAVARGLVAAPSSLAGQMLPDSLSAHAAHQQKKMKENLAQGNYLAALRYGAKGVGSTLADYLVGPVVRVASNAPNMLVGADPYGGKEKAQQVAKRFGTELGTLDVKGGTPAAQDATRAVLNNVGLPASQLGVAGYNAAQILPDAFMAGLTGGAQAKYLAGPALRGTRWAAGRLPAGARNAYKSAVDWASKRVPYKPAVPSSAPSPVPASGWVSGAKDIGRTAAGQTAIETGNALANSVWGQSPYLQNTVANLTGRSVEDVVSDLYSKPVDVSGLRKKGNAAPPTQPGKQPLQPYPAGMSEVNRSFLNAGYGALRRRTNEGTGMPRYVAGVLDQALPYFGFPSLSQLNAPYRGYDVPIMLDRISNAAYNTPVAQQASNPHGLTEEGQVLYNAYNRNGSLAERININPQGGY